MKSTEELTKQLDEIRSALLQRDLKGLQVEEIASELDKLEALVSPEPKKARSLRELKGLGKELWRSVDVDQYLREERRSWR